MQDKSKFKYNYNLFNKYILYFSPIWGLPGCGCRCLEIVTLEAGEEKQTHVSGVICQKHRPLSHQVPRGKIVNKDL
jgi:hypothetical protein